MCLGWSWFTGSAASPRLVGIVSVPTRITWNWAWWQPKSKGDKSFESTVDRVRIVSRRSDRIRVDPSDPSPIERVAQKYLWKNYSLYDKNLHNLRPAQCYRAATADGSNALCVVSEHEEEKLAAEGRLVKEKNLLWMASRVLDRVEDGRNLRRSWDAHFRTRIDLCWLYQEHDTDKTHGAPRE
jgi:hypothetical protein